ncbi:MAG TPA: hypothetical protein VES97_09530, partial [Solirubrobacteraceae bacterium]|nr:hypothetical protein [Solirubrobacteraceae bacterium]
MSVLVAAVTFWAGTKIRGETRLAPQHIPEPRVTVAVEHRVLTDTLQAHGVVEAPAGVSIAPLTPQLEGEEVPIVSRLPVKPRSRIDSGTVLAEIAGRPIIVLPGTIPMYRTLKVGMGG